MGTMTVSAHYLTYRSREKAKGAKIDSVFQFELIHNANCSKKERRLLC